MERQAAALWRSLKNAAHNSVLGAYVIGPLRVVLRDIAGYARDLVYSLLLVPKLHQKRRESSEEDALRQSRNFLIGSIVFAAALVGFVAFHPDSPVTSRTEMLIRWADDLLPGFATSLLFVIQGSIAWLLLKRHFFITLSYKRFFSLLAYLVGGAGIVLTAILQSFEFGIPPDILTRHFNSLLRLEGSMGLVLIGIGSILLCAYFWPYFNKNKYVSAILTVTVWHLVWLGMAAAQFAVTSARLDDLKDKIAADDLSRTEDQLLPIAEKRLGFWLAFLRANGRPPSREEQWQANPAHDLWQNPIASFVFVYRNWAGFMQPYCLAVSNGPNGLLDITANDVEELSSKLTSGPFARLTDVDYFVDSALSEYDPISSDRNAGTETDGSPLGRISWSNVDIFATMGVKHREWTQKGGNVPEIQRLLEDFAKEPGER